MSESDRFSKFGETHSVRANIKHKSIRSTTFVAVGNAAELVMRLASIAILARLLMPEDFGLIAIVLSLTSVIDSFRDFGLSTATVQRSDITHREVSNLFWVNAVLGIGLALALCASAPLIAEFYQDERLVGITVTLSSMFVWNGLSVQHSALMARQLRQGELVLIRLLATSLSVAFAAYLAINDWGYWSLVWREVARISFISLGIWLCCRWLPGWPRRHVGTRSLIRFGGELSIANLLVGLISEVDKLLVGRFFGATVVGFYRQAQQLVLVPIDQLNGPITAVSQPALSALQLEPNRYRRFYERVVFFVTLGTLPLGLFIAVCAEEITVMMLGPAWIDAAPFVRIFGVAAAVRPAIGTSAAVLITYGRSRRYLIVAIAHSLLLTMMMLLGLRWGALGVALAHVLTTLVLAYPKLYFSFIGTPVTLKSFLASVRTPMISGAAMVSGLVIVRYFSSLDGAFESLLLSGLVAAAIYGATVWIQPAARDAIRTILVDALAALRNKTSAPSSSAS